MKKTLMLMVTAICLGSGSIYGMGASTKPGGSPAAFKKVMLVIFENTNYKDAIAQPYFAKLARDGGLFTNFHAEAHPSQSNYISLVSGDSQGITGDGKSDVDAKNIVDLLEAKGKTWKVYAEDYPGNCFTGNKGKYVRKHNPLISFLDISKNAKRCANIVNANQLKTDIQNKMVADFSMYIPNLDNDGHDTSVTFADKWYEKTFAPLLTDTSFSQDLLLISTFDEDDKTKNNLIYTSFYGTGVKAGSTSAVKYDHYSMLRTIEDGLEIGTLGKKDATAIPMTGIWK